MDKDVLNPAEELHEIVGTLRQCLINDREWGLEPPPLSPSAVEYLDKGSGSPGSLEGLRELIGDCRRCKLWRGRTHLVFGEGSPQARLIFVGEGPGEEEDLKGRPFVGKAGELLTRIIVSGMRLKREEVYICNVVKCRPPNNRDPEPDEIAACFPFLKKQISLIGPQVICALGRVAAGGLLGREVKITRERGKWLSCMDIPLMLTYHPAFVLRTPARERELKGHVWEDVQKIMKHLGLEVEKH